MKAATNGKTVKQNMNIITPVYIKQCDLYKSYGSEIQCAICLILVHVMPLHSVCIMERLSQCSPVTKMNSTREPTIGTAS